MEGLSFFEQVGDILDPPQTLRGDPWQPKNVLEDNSQGRETAVAFLRQESESLSRQVTELQRSLGEKEGEVRKMAGDLNAAMESAETLRGEVREKEETIAELKQKITSLEETVRQQQQKPLETTVCQQKQQQQKQQQKPLEATACQKNKQQQQQKQQKRSQKRHGFPKLSMSKLSLSRSSSAPDVHSRSSPTSRRRRPILKSDPHSGDRLSPSLLSPLLELSAPLEEESADSRLLPETKRDDDNDGGDLDVFVASTGDDVSQSSSPGATSGGRSPGVTSRNADISTSSDSTTSLGSASFSPTATAAATPVETVDVSDLRWKEGKKAPEKMSRGAVAVSGNTAFFRPSASYKVFSCTLTSGKTHWSGFPDGKFQNFGLVILGNHLVSVGGQTLSGDYGTTSELLSLSLSPRKKQWVKILPPMPTNRCNPAAVNVASGQVLATGSNSVLVVAGGYDKGKELACVEVLDIGSNVWYRVPNLPEKMSNLVGTFCHGELFLGGGFFGRASKSVFACPLTSLLRCSNGGTCENGGIEGRGGERGEGEFWRRVEDLPVTNSTVVEFCGNLLAVGGTCDFTDTPTNRVYRLSTESGEWEEVCVMRHKRERCFVAVLASSTETKLVVVGGVSLSGSKTDHVEIADIRSFNL